MGLLALDGALAVGAVFVGWDWWIVFAYVPLLITLGLGGVMSGWGRWLGIVVAILTGGVMAGLWIALFAGPAGMDRLDIALRIGVIGLTVAGGLLIAATGWGWIRFFRGRVA